MYITKHKYNCYVNVGCVCVMPDFVFCIYGKDRNLQFNIVVRARALQSLHKVNVHLAQ
jgi:hypothetical protein